MRVDWCVSSWFRIKNTHSLTHYFELSLVGCLVSLFVSVCRSVRVVIICPASTHTALVSSE